MYTDFSNCKLCPKNCGADRNSGKLGFCRATNKMEICRIGLHFWEEPVISGKNGSGTVFFAHCNLGCIYCQNFEISKGSAAGKIYSAQDLAYEMINLQKNNAHNINLVTPTHYMPIIKDAVLKAKNMGLNIPIVYNTSGFEHPEIISSLKGTADIFLTDLKYFSPYYSKLYSNCEDYFDFASKSIEAMINVTGNVKINSENIMEKGVIIRHLMLPTLGDDTARVLKYIANNFEDKVLVSLMRQYTPVCPGLPNELKRKITDREYNNAKELFDFLELEGFEQEKSAAGIDKIPKWDI